MSASRPVSPPARGTSRRLRVGFQGEPGAYSEQALRQLLGPRVEAVPRPDFETLHRELREGGLDRALLPVENSLAGTQNLHDNWEFLASPDVWAAAETILRVRHCALVLPGTRASAVREVRSHPQALAQCRRNLRKLFPKAAAVQAWDTAGSARLLSEEREPSVAVVASRLAGETWGLEVLREGLEDDPSNFTRFLLASREPAPPRRKGETGERKTALAFTLDHAGPGSLFRALGCFALRDLDLARIESRPIAGSPWRYRFFAEVRAGSEEPRCARALEQLTELSTEVSVLGSFPAWPLESP